MKPGRFWSLSVFWGEGPAFHQIPAGFVMYKRSQRYESQSDLHQLLLARLQGWGAQPLKAGPSAPHASVPEAPSCPIRSSRRMDLQMSS